MSCDASIVVTTTDDATVGDELCARAVERLHQLEQRWSRFLPDSEISGLNAAGGEPRRVTDDTLRLVESLVRGWFATGGSFDPTLLGTIVELGYAASRDDATIRTSLAAGVHPRGHPDAVLVDPIARIVQLPPGTTLDAGGMGKGLAADLVTAELRAEGAAGALVEIGGDIRVVGTPPVGGAWAIAIRPSSGSGAPRIVDVVDGGIATSSSRLRTWTCDGRTRHHLVDPGTLASTSRDVVSCTVLAGTAAWSEAFTKVAFAEGAAAALERLTAHSLAASITTADGSHHTTDAWKEFVR